MTDGKRLASTPPQSATFYDNVYNNLAYDCLYISNNSSNNNVHDDDYGDSERRGLRRGGGGGVGNGKTEDTVFSHTNDRVNGPRKTGLFFTDESLAGRDVDNGSPSTGS